MLLFEGSDAPCINVTIEDVVIGHADGMSWHVRHCRAILWLFWVGCAAMSLMLHFEHQQLAMCRLQLVILFITLISIIKFIVVFTVDETGNLNPAHSL